VVQVFGKSPVDRQQVADATVPPLAVHAAASPESVVAESVAESLPESLVAESAPESAGAESVAESTGAESVPESVVTSEPLSVGVVVPPSSSEHPVKTSARTATEARRVRFMARRRAADVPARDG